MSPLARTLATLAAVAVTAAYAELAETHFAEPHAWAYQTGAALACSIAVLLALGPLIRDPRP